MGAHYLVGSALFYFRGTCLLRVLLVAPRTNLLLADEEVQDITRSGLIVTPLLGNVTRSELLRDIKGGAYDVLWFATHGSAEGIQLSDGMLAAHDLVPLIRERFRLVILNTCSSLLTAQQIQEDANVGVICTITDVPDPQAYQMGSLLASHLAAGKSVHDAYKLSKRGGNRIYLYLPALSPTEDVIDSLVSEIRDLRLQLESQTVALVKSNKRLWWIVATMGALFAMNLMTWAWLLTQGG
jgi:hypothetical protein